MHVNSFNRFIRLYKLEKIRGGEIRALISPVFVIEFNFDAAHTPSALPPTLSSVHRS